MIRMAKSFGTIFVQSVKTSLFCFFPLVLSSAIFFVPFFLLDRFFWNDEAAYDRMVSLLTLPGYTVVDVLVSTFFFAFFFLYLIALTNILRAYDRREKMSFWRAYTAGIKKWRAYFFLQVVIGFHTLIRLVLIYPGVVYFARHSLAGFILLDEKDDMTRKEALRRSQELQQGNVHYFLDHMAVVTVFILMISFPYFEFLEKLYAQQHMSYNFSMSTAIDYTQTFSMIWIFIYLYIYYYYLYIHISRDNRGEEHESNN